jgi:hypothetical protein
MVRVTQNLKSQIIHKHLYYNSLSQIAKETNVSKTTVFNVIHDWESRVNATDLDEIRLLLREIRTSGITIQQCVRGFRTEQILRQFEIKDELEGWIDNEIVEENTESKGTDTLSNQLNFDPTTPESLSDKGDKISNKRRERNKINKKNYEIYDFINDIYKKCNANSINSGIIVKWITDLFHFYSFMDEKQISDDTNDYYSLYHEENTRNTKNKKMNLMMS